MRRVFGRGTLFHLTPDYGLLLNAVGEHILLTRHFKW